MSCVYLRNSTTVEGWKFCNYDAGGAASFPVPNGAHWKIGEPEENAMSVYK